ncbi:hypothetical protein KTS45_16420 [Halomicroarcula limicola]|uniref:Uncharacterized protein n=1 Tax=Haloarcula limicola TaxID=1429915 RepID=A0A8J7Y726_9EURY|nr:hypothetical protein [Halomicroarcula limicola]MBV0925790.1 hypothetical protein [Halomicroarcula limicola]
MRRVVVVLLAGCLVTAGCTALVGPRDPAASETLTPAPVPEEPPARVAPGLTETGVTDSDALAQAHVVRLSNVSYTLWYTRTVRTGDGDVRLRQTTVFRTGANYREYVARRTVTGTSVPETELRTRWTDGRAIERTTVNETTRREVVADGRGIGAPPLPPREALFFEPTYNSRLASLFDGANVTDVSPAREEVRQTYGAPVYRVSADGATDRSQFPVAPAERVGDVGFTAVVGPEGLVYDYGVQYTVVRNGTTLRVTESLRYGEVGTTTPELDGRTER